MVLGLVLSSKRPMNRPIRIAVTGLTGQLVQCLAEIGQKKRDVKVIKLGRPLLDLTRTATIARALIAASPDLVVNTAAYTAVDLAENDPELAYQVNAIAPGELARVTKEMRIPFIHLSTDYVFDGKKTIPYVETDTPAPLGVYGHSKLHGELAVSRMTDDYAILRTAWLYSPFGRNFLTTMLGRAETMDEVPVVADQFGNPTNALALASAILTVGRNLLMSNGSDMRGVFHLAGSGHASWADFAQEIFSASRQLGGPFAEVKRISSADYKTMAKRPKYSNLSSRSAKEIHGTVLPDWRNSTTQIVSRLIQN
ncbi:dTDP-4-dehydrorhamnose reductase [Ensifer sp. ENS08]|uniref:dTDP-4-dehydrorhamnose reductase n=1 Tax=Ensifer sp. ENS08 TaxID=2769273 RepID=UPI001FF0478E|nr:dTDP-4-dehydrorhamnose reductase [Ensifer sp. ENS08]